MPEPVSVTTAGLCVAYAAFAGLRKSSAVSEASNALRHNIGEVVEASERSLALFGGKAGAISELRALSNVCAVPDWDGEGAAVLDPASVAQAEDFVRALPDNLPMPEFAADPDGSVSLDWIKSRYRMFSLSIGTSNRLSYAWLDGTDKGHAVARFDGMNIPSRVLEGIRSIVDDGNTPLRFA